MGHEHPAPSVRPSTGGSTDPSRRLFLVGGSLTLALGSALAGAPGALAAGRDDATTAGAGRPDAGSVERA